MVIIETIPSAGYFLKKIKILVLSYDNIIIQQ